MDKRIIIFYGFTDNNIAETTECNDLGEAYELFNNALKENKYDYMDITLTNEENFTCKTVRKYSK